MPATFYERQGAPEEIADAHNAVERSAVIGNVVLYDA